MTDLGVGAGATSARARPEALRGGGPRPVPRWERAARTATGIGFGGAAVGNLVGSLPRAGELLPWFAETAWLPPYPWILRHLLPVAPPVVAATAAFEAVVAGMLLTHRHEAAALALATAFQLGLVPAMGWPYWTVNVVLGGATAGLAVRAARPGPGPTAQAR